MNAEAFLFHVRSAVSTAVLSPESGQFIQRCWLGLKRKQWRPRDTKWLSKKAQPLSNHWDLGLSAIILNNTSIQKFHRIVLKQVWEVLLTRTEGLEKSTSSKTLGDYLLLFYFLETGTLISMNSGIINTCSRTIAINSDCPRQIRPHGHLTVLYCIVNTENWSWIYSYGGQIRTWENQFTRSGGGKSQIREVIREKIELSEIVSIEDLRQFIIKDCRGMRQWLDIGPTDLYIHIQKKSTCL